MTTARYVGIMAGPAVGTLLARGVGYTPAFLTASGVLSLTTLAVCLWLPPHSPVLPHAATPAPDFASGFTGPLVLAYGLAIVLGWPQGVTSAIWSLYMHDRGASLPLIGLSYTIFALAASALAPVAGGIADRYGRWRPTLTGLMLSGVVYCVYGFRLPLEWIMALTLVEGVGLAVARVATDGFLADHVPQGRQGRIPALFSAAGTAGSLAGATVLGWLYAVEPGMPLLTMGMLYLLVAVVLLGACKWGSSSVVVVSSESESDRSHTVPLQR